MSALLQHAARRIGGSMLRRSQAALTSPAVAEEPRRHLPRRMTTHEHVRARPDHGLEIQQMKEKLYDVLCKVGTMGERTLLQDLASHVNPRPQEARWRGLRVARRIGDFVEITGIALFASLVVVVNGVSRGYNEAMKRDEAMKMQDRIKKQVTMQRENQVETLLENQ